MKLSDNKIYSQAKEVEFSAQTNNFLNNIFKVDNYYRCIYDKNNFIPIKKEKEINQPNLQQSIKVDYDKFSATYSNGSSIKTKPNTFSFFSLLMYLRNVKPKQQDGEKLNLEIGGKKYIAKLSYLGTKTISIGQKLETQGIGIRLKRRNTNSKAVLKKTDIFFKYIANPEGKRSIWIEEKDPKRIIKATFELGAKRLTAKLEGENH